MEGDFFVRTLCAPIQFRRFSTNSGKRIVKKKTIWYDIVREEISTYFGGLGTAEACAKKIQSRVTIWLSENE